MIKKIPEDTKYYHFHNENPKGLRTNDCVIRAIATATNQSWDEVFEGLYSLSKKYKIMPNDKKCYAKYLKNLGWEKQKQPRKADNTKYTGEEFCAELQNNPWNFIGNTNTDSVIAHIGGRHIVCIKSGVIYDIWDSSDGCIGNYFIKSENVSNG